MSLDSILTLLEDDQIIRAAKDDERTFIFKNALSQQAAYQSLLTKNRRELHRCVAETYEKLYVGQLDEIVPLLAEHYYAAGDSAKTFEYSSRAGHAAMRTYASAEAILHFTRAIQAAQRLDPGLLPTAAREEFSLTDCYLHLGRVLEMAGQIHTASQTYEEMESLAHQRNDQAMELAALVALATIHSTVTSISNETHARSLSNLALGLAREIGDRETEARVLWNLTLLSSNTGKMQSAIEYGEQSLAIAQELGMREQIAYTSNDLFRPYMSVGNYDRGQSLAAISQQYFRDTGNQAMLADNLGRAIVVNSVFANFDAALEASTEALQISESIGNAWGQAFSQMITGNIYFQRGEMTRAMDTMRESIRQAEIAGFLFPQIWTRSELGALYGDLGNPAQGMELANQAYALTVERFPHGTSRIHGVLARLALMQGDVATAETHLAQGKTTLASDFAQRSLDQFPLLELRVELAKNNFAHARELVDSLLESGSVFVRAFQSDLHYLKGNVLLGLGDAEAARQAWLRALTEADKIGSRWMQWQIYAALGEREQARRVVDYIVQNMPAEWRGSFLGLASVQEVIGHGA